MALRDIFWCSIPPTRIGVFSGRIKCPCEVQFWDTMDSFFPDVSQKTLVDLGCGPGIKALTLAIAGARIIGFDARESSIQHAQENARQIQTHHPEYNIQTQFYQKNLEQGLPEIADHSVDIVVFVEVIEHLEGYENVLAEIRRILKPGGKVVITTPNKTFHEKEKEADEQVYGEKAFGHVRDFDLEELSAVVKQAGLHIVYQGYINPPKSTALCRWIHPWMIRDHGFLQQKENIDDVIGIRSLGFLQPVYNTLFPLVSLMIAGYNRLIFPLFYHLTKSSNSISNGKTLFVVGTKT